MTDLTVGKPWTVLWKFSLPMFVSVIFQQMYSIFDSIIAGKFAGEDALAAVGASYPITMIFMAFAVGSNVGCSNGLLKESPHQDAYISQKRKNVNKKTGGRSGHSQITIKK